jgi:hypothetical protein
MADIPPIIEPAPAKVVALEVVPPQSSAAAPTNLAPAADDRPPIHTLSALILVAVDSLWAIFDFAPPVWIFAIPFCFLATFVPTYLIQRNLRGDAPARALTFATLMGVLAAIPVPVTGTAVGFGLLAWTGLGKLLGRPIPK